MRLKPIYIPEDQVYDVHIDSIPNNAKILVYQENKLIGIITGFNSNKEYQLSAFDMNRNSNYYDYDTFGNVKSLLIDLQLQLGCTFKILED